MPKSEDFSLIISEIFVVVLLLFSNSLIFSRLNFFKSLVNFFKSLVSKRFSLLNSEDFFSIIFGISVVVVLSVLVLLLFSNLLVFSGPNLTLSLTNLYKK